MCLRVDMTTNWCKQMWRSSLKFTVGRLSWTSAKQTPVIASNQALSFQRFMILKLENEALAGPSVQKFSTTYFLIFLPVWYTVSLLTHHVTIASNGLLLELHKGGNKNMLWQCDNCQKHIFSRNMCRVRIWRLDLTFPGELSQSWQQPLSGWNSLIEQHVLVAGIN